MGGVSDTTAPTMTIEALSAVANVVSMRITASEEVSGFAVGDITISAGGSLANFATADNIIFTVDWTLAEGNNTMDINAAVCQDLAGNDNVAATGLLLVYFVAQGASADTFIDQGAPNTNFGTNPRLYTQLYSAGRIFRALAKFDLSSILNSPTILSGILTLYSDQGVAVAAGEVHRVLAGNSAWTEAGATWNKAVNPDTDWAGSAGCGTADTDYESTVMGTYPADAVAGGSPRNITLDTDKLALMIANNYGVLIKAQNEAAENVADTHRSSNHATETTRPKIAIVYRPM